MKSEYKITTKSYKEAQQLKDWGDCIVYKSCRIYSKKNYKRTEFYIDDSVKNLHCVMEEKISKKPYLKETNVSFLSEEWSKREEENPEEHRWYSVKIIIDDKYQTIFWYRDKNFEIPLQKEVLFKKGVKHSEEDAYCIGTTHYDKEGNLVPPKESENGIQYLVDYMITNKT